MTIEQATQQLLKSGRQIRRKSWSSYFRVWVGVGGTLWRGHLSGDWHWVPNVDDLLADDWMEHKP